MQDFNTPPDDDSENSERLKLDFGETFEESTSFDDNSRSQFTTQMNSGGKSDIESGSKPKKRKVEAERLNSSLQDKTVVVSKSAYKSMISETNDCYD